MKRILVTGARAPAALEIIRRLAKAEYETYAADCLYYPPGRFSRHVKAYLQHPSPRYDLNGYVKKLIEFIQKHQIDLIFPICEEVFYLGARKEEIEKHCMILCEDMPMLTALHNKSVFQTLARQHGMGAIETSVIDIHNKNKIVDSLPEDKRYVVKPVFSRFGDKAVLNLKPDEIHKNLKPELFPWAVQEYIEGQEYCTYALCRNGKVLAQACYKPVFRAGQGSSVYFQPILQDEIFRQVRSVVSSLNYSGQIGFDFIEQSNGNVFVLECNPRCTSGAHILPEDIDWKVLFSADGPKEIDQEPEPAMRSKMVSLAMLIYGMKTPNNAPFKDFWRAFREADDVVGGHKDWSPFSGQVVSLFELFWRSWLTGKSLKDASTADIEWDGQSLD